LEDRVDYFIVLL